MNAGNPKDSEPLDDESELDSEKDEEGQEVAGEILQPSMPPPGAAVMIEIDPRLNRPSETEKELEELVESNEDAEDEIEEEEAETNDKA